MDPLAGATISAGPAPAVANDPLVGAKVGGTTATKAVAAPAAPNFDALEGATLNTSGSKIASNLSPTTPAITAPKPADTSNIFQKFLSGVKGIPDDIERTITPPTPDQLGTNATANTLKILPSELARQIPGVADLQDTPIEPGTLSNSDFIKAVPTALGDTTQGIVKAPITALADVWDAARTFVGKNPDASFTIPGLGKVTSNQLDVAQAIQQGQDPVTAALSAGSSSIFNTLFFADVVNRVTGPRTVTVGKTTGNVNDLPKVGDAYRPTVDVGPKTGHLYEPPTAYNKGGAQVLPKPVLDTMESQGIKLGSAFKPEQPVFFKLTIGKDGAYTGEIIQLKPSYLQEAITKVFGTKTTAPENTLSGLLGAAPETPAKAINPADLGAVADAAQPKDITVIHSQTVKGGDIVKAVNDTIQKAPEPKVPAAAPVSPNTSHVVAHNAIRLLGGDTSSAPDHAKVLLENTQKAIKVHGPLATHQALMDQLGMGEGQATALIKEAQTPQTEAQKNAVIEAHAASLITPEGQALEGVNPKQPTRLSVAEAAPLAAKAAAHYYAAKIAPAIKEGKMTVVGGDDLKDYFGNDYNDNNHPIYSQAANKVFERLLKENKDSGVVFTGGGPGSGKTELIVNHLRESGFKGIVYDSNFSNYEGAVKQIETARKAGKKIRIAGVLPNLEKARGFTIAREAEKGRGIQDATFARGHHGFPDVVRQLLENGIVKPEEVRLFDTRNTEGLDNAKAMIKGGGYVSDPLATIKNLGYTKEKIQESYGKENYTKEGTYLGRSGQEFPDSGVRKQADSSSAAYRTNSQRGFVNPEQIAKDAAAAIQRVQDTIKELENVRELSGDIRDAGYQHENKRVANRQRLINLANEVGDMLDANGWNDLYHYDENSDEKITPAEKAIYDGVIKPLKDSLSTIITEYKTLGGHMDAELFFMENEGYTPRFAKDKGGAIDKIIDDFKKVGTAAKKTLQNGGLLSKSLGTVDKSRKFFALTDEQGNRSVAHIPTNKSQQVLGFNKGKITELGQPKMKKNEAVLNEKIKPFQEKITALQTEINTLESVKAGSTGIEGKLAEIKRKALDLDVRFLDTPDVRDDKTLTKDTAALKKAIRDIKLLSKVKPAESIILRNQRIGTLRTKMAEASNAMAAIENTFNPDALNQRVFVDKEGNRYQVGQATTKEIEAHTKVRYHTNVLANYLVALDRATNALNAMRLLDRIKNEDEFGDIIRKDNPDEATPEGWKSVGDVLPQFRGYHLEPHAAEVLQDLANRQKGQLHVPVIDEINNFLVGAIVFNPVMHVPNVIAGRSTAASALGVPAKSLANLHTAINEVKNAGPLYLSYLEHGAPFMALKATTKNFTDAILTQYTDQIENEKDPGFLAEHEQLAKILGYTNPAALARGLKHINETATWGSNDLLFMHALLDYKDVHDGSMEEAIKAVSKYMADYRIPERVLLPGQAGRVMSQALQSRAFLFGRFHYTGVIKPWIEAAKNGAGPNSTGKQRLQGLRALAYMLAMGLIVWPYINKMWQGITGSPTSYESMPGPLRPVQVVQKALQAGPAGAPAALNSIFTVSPALRSMIELGFNVDLFTRNPIYGQLPAEGLSAYGTSVLSPLASASRMNPGDFALSLFGIWTPKNVPAKTTLDSMKYDELPALQTQVKKDIAAGNQQKANDEMMEFNTRAVATWNQYELQTGGTDLVTTDAEKQAFLKTYGIKEPGAIALTHANTLYGDGSLTAKSSLVSNIATYAKAVGVSPAEAFHLIFTGQTIARVSNFGLFDDKSAIIVERMSLADSEAVKTDRNAQQGQVLDHVIPLEAGGTNDVGNLNLIPAANNLGEQHTFENALGDAVKAGQITQAQVREYSIRYKVGQGETLPDAYMQEFETKYGGKTMTLQEVEDAIDGK